MGWFFGHWKLELPAWAILSLSLYSFVTNPETALWLGIHVRNAAILVACALPPAMLAWYLWTEKPFSLAYDVSDTKCGST